MFRGALRENFIDDKFLSREDVFEISCMSNHAGFFLNDEIDEQVIKHELCEVIVTHFDRNIGQKLFY